LIENAIGLAGLTMFLINIKIMRRLLREVTSLKFSVEKETSTDKEKRLFSRSLKAVVERAEIASLSESNDPPSDLHSRNKRNINECQVIASILYSSEIEQDTVDENVIELSRIRPNR
jgi:hypothetical protein